MKKSLLVAAVAVAAVLVPASAPAAAWQGVVVAKDSGRSTVATASRGGVVRSVRSSAVGSLRVGDRVAVRAVRRADGTYAASRVRRTGRAAGAVVRGTVIAHQRRLGRTLLSAGGSVVAVRRATAARVPALAGDDAGDVVSASVRIRSGRLSAARVREVGHAEVLELRGIFLDVENGVFRLAVVKRGLVAVRVPEGVSVPDLDPGDLVFVVASLDEEGRLVLVSAKRDGKGSGDEGVDVENDEVTVKGTIAALAAGSVSVRAGAGSPVECAVPESAPLVGFFVGDEAELHCHFVDGRFRLEYLSGKSAWLKVRDGVVKADFGLYGVLTELGAETVHVTVRGRALSCARPAGADLAAFAVGSEVKLGCELVNGAFRLSFLKSSSASWFAGDEGEAPTGEMTVEGTLEAITAESASVRKASALFTCAHANAGLPAVFPTGQPVTMRCRLGANGWRVAKLYSATASVILEP